MKNLKNQTGNGSSYSRGLARGSVLAKERLLAPDLARGFMLLIIALAHAPLLLDRQDGGGVIDKAVNFVSILFVDNRGLPLFAILLGYGLAMMVNRQLSAGTLEVESKRLLRRRGSFLLLFGFVHTVIIGGIDILAFYGFSTLLIGWILFRQNRVLNRAILLVSLFFLFLLPVVWIGMAHVMNASGVSMETLGQSNSESYIETTLFNLISFPFMILIQLFMYPMLLPILIGVWAARHNLLLVGNRKHLVRIAVIGTSISILGGLPLALDGTPLWSSSPTIEGLFIALQMITGLAGGIGYAAIFGLIGSFVSRTGLMVRSLTALGQRSLTFYVFIEALLVITLSPVGFGLGRVLHSTGAVIIAVFVWLTSLLLAMMMEYKGMRGPLDALLRRLIYRS
ncbi:DUF418 domain-containing protein [Gracilibacillus alcaliphilus]|uniref:DUF418 domain-containing protein n=1 Tax=Gracilibacillus alcaliphilus TaxID=1401441 RepID=UPI00195A8D44|nr:DUF418 domain-containing protein [Gracilibacillus alcaliphilus]MBM7678847.1 putative membrane protein YeiB [Gracilibacillus alcaliphilus]